MTTFRRFLIRCCLFTALVSGVLGAALAIPNPMLTKDSLFAAIRDKHQLLDTRPSPKIVLVGGSNVVFGTNTPRIEQALGRPAINAGLHARLGLKFMLDDVADPLQSGDVLVVTPEYEQLTGWFYGGRELTALLIDVYPEGRKHLSFSQAVVLSQFVPMHAASKLLHARWTDQGIQARYENPGIYHRSSFNTHGDVIAHWSEERRPFSPAAASTPRTPDLPAIHYLRDIHDALRQRGVRMILLPPGLQKTSFDNMRPIIDRLSELLQEEGIPFAADPARYRLDDALCFDSPYHFTEQGVDQRTTLVIEDLKRLLTD